MRKYGFSFSWKRAIGLTGLRQSVAKNIGIPTTKSGLERNIGRTLIRFILKIIGIKY